MSRSENAQHAPQYARCIRAKLKRNVLEGVRIWLNTLYQRKSEVIETFRDEGVWIESIFLDTIEGVDYLIYYMRADDVDQALSVFQKSTHPIDHFHKECWSQYVEDCVILELGCDLQREHAAFLPARPEDVFVDVIALSTKHCTSPIQGLLAYATRENFVGRVIDGYAPNASRVCLLSRKAAEQLCSVQNSLNRQGLGLFVFDAYRPLRAVHDFSIWYQQCPANAYEQERKNLHFPHLEKTDLFRLGYAPEKVSRHCFGNSVDVSLIDLKTNQLLDMGTIFDFFDEKSHHPAAKPEEIGESAYRNRELLAQVMQEHGFIPYPKEYWHFDYKEREINEPADIEIVPSLMGLNVK